MEREERERLKMKGWAEGETKEVGGGSRK